MTIRIALIVFSILAAFSCNNQQSKRTGDDSSADRNQSSDKFIIKKPDKTVQSESESCESLVTQILNTSPRYKQLTKGLKKAVVKNGGYTYGISMEGSPNHSKDKAWNYSKTYDFTLYEVYEDRQLNTARFSFDPGNKQLYEYDAANDQKKTIEFDRNLLIKFEALCK